MVILDVDTSSPQKNDQASCINSNVNVSFIYIPRIKLDFTSMLLNWNCTVLCLSHFCQPFENCVFYFVSEICFDPRFVQAHILVSMFHFIFTVFKKSNPQFVVVVNTQFYITALIFCFNSFSANGNIENLANNTESDESALTESSHLK